MALFEWKTLGNGKQKAHSISLADRIAAIAPSVDCDIFVEEYEKLRVCAHHADWHMQESEEWLRSLTRADLREDEQFDATLKEVAARLKTITFAGRVVSRAALLDTAGDTRKRHDAGLFGCGIVTHGGLASEGAADEWLDDVAFVGVMEAEPAAATRFRKSFESGRVLSDPQSLSDWIRFQKAFLPLEAESDVSILRYFSNFGQLGFLPVINFVLRRFDLAAYPKSMDELQLVSYETLLLAASGSIELRFLTLDDSILFFVYYDDDEVKALVDLMQAIQIDSIYFSPVGAGEINRIPKLPDQTGEALSLLSILRELFRSRGFTVQIETEGFGMNVTPPFYTDGILTFRATRG